MAYVCIYIYVHVRMYTNIVQRAFFFLLHKRKEQSGYSKESEHDTHDERKLVV